MSKHIKKVGRFFTYFFGILGLIMISVGSWALFKLAEMGTSDILEFFGITNEYVKYVIIVFVILVGLALSGVSAFKALKKLATG